MTAMAGLKYASNTGKCSMLFTGEGIIGYLFSTLRYGEELNWFAVGGSLIILWAMGVVLIGEEKDNMDKDVETDG